MPQKCVLGKVRLSSVGKLCLVAPSGARQKQIIQRLLFLPFLLQLIGAVLPFLELAQNLSVPACGLINRQLGQALRLEFSKARAQPIRRYLQLQLPFSNFHEVSSGQFERQVLFPLPPNADLFCADLLQFVFGLDDLLNNAEQRGLFRMFYTFAKAQHRIETEAECHI